MKKKQTRTKVIPAIRVTADEWRRVRAQAKAEGKKFSQFARERLGLLGR